MEPVASTIPSASYRAVHKSLSDGPVIPPSDPADDGSTSGSGQVRSGPRPMDGHATSFGPFRLLRAQRLLLEGDKPVRLGSRAFCRAALQLLEPRPQLLYFFNRPSIV